jgi:uncharacterized protein (DUF58 family)
VKPRASAPQVTVSTSAQTAREGQAFDVAVTLHAVTDIDAAAVRVNAPTFAFAAGAATTVTAVAAGSSTVVHVRLVATRWGRREIGPVTVSTTGSHLLTKATRPATVAPIPIKVIPALQRFDASDVTPHALVYSGSHRSRMTGPGVEFASIRPFQPADRPRRINWRVSLRSSQLHVNATYTDRASRLLVVIDSLHSAGRPGNTSIDIAVRAAAGIAEHYLSIGDTVGLVEYGGRNRILHPSSGHRHTALVQDWLIDVGPLSAAVPPAQRWLASLPTGGALVIALSPLLDEDAAAHLVTLRSRGASLIAVDCLPVDAVPAPTDHQAAIAERLWRLEREALVDRLGELGVPVVPRSGAGTLDQVLTDLARLATAPKAALR